MKLSVILPTYNEGGNIVDLVRCILKNIPGGWEYEIMVVDDNSPDGTFEIVQHAFQENATVIPILRTSDRGLAKAIRTGVEKSQGDQILVMDTDFTHDPGEIPKMLHLSKIYDIVSGSRFCAGGSMDDISHYIASLVYNWLIRVVLRTQIQDNLGGFFSIKRDRLELLPFDSIFFGHGDYFFRLLNYSQQVGLTIVEIPTQYRARHKGDSKSNFPKLLVAYTVALIKYRLKLFM